MVIEISTPSEVVVASTGSTRPTGQCAATADCPGGGGRQPARTNQNRRRQARVSASDARCRRRRWISALPGLAIVVTVLGANLFGDALRRSLDPRLRGVS
jgi:hypothetical protein